MGDRRRDDNREHPTQPKSEHKREPGKYYYDDSTGYEKYDPESVEDDEEDGGEEADLTTSSTKLRGYFS